ncbi:MAG: hypothetical protein MJE68_17330 [Proteobacteria bacterium]|nr:hypothetical protein [Pseudomonadota bacterium]
MDEREGERERGRERGNSDYHHSKVTCMEKTIFKGYVFDKITTLMTVVQVGRCQQVEPSMREEAMSPQEKYLL